MIENIKHGSGAVDFTYDGIDYRVATANISIFDQQDLIALVQPATEGDEINPISSAFNLAAREILKRALIKDGDYFTPLTTENQKNVFNKEFAKRLPDNKNGLGLVVHFNTVALFVYQFLVDEDWSPEKGQEGDGKKSIQKNTPSGEVKTEQKATLKTTL